MEQIIRCLKDYKEINNIEAPKTTGFYAFYTIANNIFEGTALSDIKKGDCIYVGIAKDETLDKRVYKSHLKTTGKSTLRRAIGAILIKKLGLEPTMRGKTATESNLRNFTFSKESEQRLTEFINNNLGVAFCSYSSIDINLEDIEKEIIKEFGYPAFNVEYVKESKYKKVIQDARKNCRAIVKSKVV
ncbi:GIY-YIG nuclease family protein [Clostridium saccharobutylicum]|uniref:GIY-YIG catalytic domain-containing protein n=1 Tax=Clostridium saccharobutylicum TaxID=169679 RepID=A0A1S8NHQ2_CLOSA|nr:hypothetical protein [Clostridium saccharobutylicum]OOM15913.1 hypothetical protein CLOSAC_01840 [Clostridium saccharobutylicum]